MNCTSLAAFALGFLRPDDPDALDAALERGEAYRLTLASTGSARAVELLDALTHEQYRRDHR